MQHYNKNNKSLASLPVSYVNKSGRSPHGSFCFRIKCLSISWGVVEVWRLKCFPWKQDNHVFICSETLQGKISQQSSSVFRKVRAVVSGEWLFRLFKDCDVWCYSLRQNTPGCLGKVLSIWRHPAFFHVSFPLDEIVPGLSRALSDSQQWIQEEI